MGDSSEENAAGRSTIIDLLIKTFPDSASVVQERINWPAVRVKLAVLPEVARFLRESPDLAFDYLTCVSGIDLKDRSPRFDLVYHLVSLQHKHVLVLKVGVGEDEEVPSLVSVWKGADWHEREAYDLLGISFSGHPDLRRILLPDEWKGHPLRKDYVLAEEDKFAGD
ncbi:MAG: NADH-quinone oxidoreductase subunit C [Candidatus Eiseniibacteriota bacterium]|nr:MAG: NADH-quinone oxidoreductase subunit C [Candidatus Eisenbacteria bacterium]